MTKSTKAARAEAKRREKEWRAALRCREERLRAMPDADLDALVADMVFSDPHLAAVPFSSGWNGFGRIVEHMRDNGYTLSCHSCEPSHLEWMKQFPSVCDTWPAEVTVVDIRRRLNLPETLPNLQVSACILPRAAAIAAVVTSEIEREQFMMPVSQPEPVAPTTGWSEERRRRQSEQMKEYWQRKHATGSGKKENNRS